MDGTHGFFNCERKTTGTRGTYYEGTYTISTVVTPVKSEPEAPQPQPPPPPIVLKDLGVTDTPKDPSPPPVMTNDLSGDQNPNVMPTTSNSDEMLRLEMKKDQGLISDLEYEIAKRSLLN